MLRKFEQNKFKSREISITLHLLLMGAEMESEGREREVGWNGRLPWLQEDEFEVEATKKAAGLDGTPDTLKREG